MIFVNIGNWPYAIEEGDFRAQGNSHMEGREHACGRFGKASCFVCVAGIIFNFFKVCQIAAFQVIFFVVSKNGKFSVLVT